jgi:hypothetical protein
MWTDPGDERESWLTEAVRELRRPVPGERRSRETVLERVRAETPTAGPLTGAWRWLTRPRRIAVSPLGALAGAAVMAVMIVAAVRFLEVPREGTTGPAKAATTPAVSPDAGVRPVRFVLVAPEAATVFLVGDFNDWDPRATPLVRSDPGGVWTAAVPLKPGLYQYSYLVDGRIRAGDVDAPRAPGDDFGAGSSVVLVKGAS